MTLVEFTLLALAAFRVSRVIISDTIFDPVRDWLLTNFPGTDVKYDDKDRHRVKGGTLEINGSFYAKTPTVVGDRIAKLVGCYACTGFWVSLVFAVFFYVAETAALVVSVPLALSSVVWFLALVQERIEED